MAKRIFPVTVIVIATMMIACSDSVVAPPKATTIEVYSFSDQQAFAGMATPADPEILVRDEAGSPIAGIPVRFTVTAGGGSVQNTATTSGPQGRATAGSWKLGPSPGLNKVLATVDGIGSIEFRADAVAVPSGTFELQTVDGKALPYTTTYDMTSLVGATFVLDASRRYTVSFRTTPAGGGVISESSNSGSFTPKAPRDLSFYVGNLPWVDGRIDGDILSVTFWDLSDFTHDYEFIREKSQ